ncbi:hypothetical protein ACFE04_003641 [Oxalis oulophora]
MPAKGRISLKKKATKKLTASASKSASKLTSSSAAAAASASLTKKDKPTPNDFLPLEGGAAARKLVVEKPLETKATVCYVGRIPHGFYEEQMTAFFSQFGPVKRLRVARNKKTGKSKHFGFIEFEYPETAQVVAECMQDYLLAEHVLKVHLIAPENVHSKIWKGFNYKHTPIDYVQIERKNLSKERTMEEYQKLVGKIVKRDQKRRKRIAAAGIDYECPEIVGSIQPASKKIKFDD